MCRNIFHNLFTRVPVVALVDGDAYGIDIVSVYKFGSVALRHELCKLAAPRVECIGVWASELASQVFLTRVQIPSHTCTYSR
jgi:meiotic recombination protein SPO11